MSYFERRVSFSFCMAFNWSLWDDWRLLISCRKPWAMSSSVASFRCLIFDSNDSLAVTSCKKIKIGIQMLTVLYRQKAFQIIPFPKFENKATKRESLICVKETVAHHRKLEDIYNLGTISTTEDQINYLFKTSERLTLIIQTKKQILMQNKISKRKLKGR